MSDDIHERVAEILDGLSLWNIPPARAIPKIVEILRREYGERRIAVVLIDALESKLSKVQEALKNLDANAAIREALDVLKEVAR